MKLRSYGLKLECKMKKNKRTFSYIIFSYLLSFRVWHFDQTSFSDLKQHYVIGVFFTLSFKGIFLQFLDL